jgi:glutamate---cysteine ligase / carboxylate-amine ligase
VTRTVGIEEEFLVVARSGPALDPGGAEVAEQADRRSEGQFEHELKREQAELGTRPHADLADLLSELRVRRAELAATADEHGARIVAIGTSPADDDATTTPAERYQRMTELFGATARSALSCGMHVHVDIASRAEGIRVLNTLRGWLPVVLALSANSPFHAGSDTGHQSYRSLLWQQWPSAGPFAPFADEADYDATVSALVGSGAAIDDHGLYFDARLSSSYPTVEIRVADVCPRVEDAVALAGLCRALVEGAASGALPAADGVAARIELVRAGMWRAARFGTEDTLVDPRGGELMPAWALVAQLVELLGPSAEDAHWVDGLEAIRARGTGSRLQRDVYERSGNFAAVVDAVADLTRS